MRRFFAVLLAVLVLCLHGASAQDPEDIILGYVSDANFAGFFDPTANWYVVTGGLAGGNALETTTFNAPLIFYVYTASPGVVIYRQTNSTFDSASVCLTGIGMSCVTMPNSTPFEITKPFFYDFTGISFHNLEVVGVEVKKSTNNANRIRIEAVYAPPFPAPTATGGPTLTPDLTEIAQYIPTPDGVTVYGTVEYDPEETPQVTAYRYEVTAGDHTIALLLIAVIVLLVLIFVSLIYVAYQGRE